MYSKKLNLSFTYIPKKAGSSLEENFHNINLHTVNVVHSTISKIKNTIVKEGFENNLKNVCKKYIICEGV